MMFIATFNKLIRNKTVWMLIAVTAGVALVFSFTQTDSGAARAAPSVGVLNGKEVSAEEFNRVYFNSYLSMSLMLGRPLNQTEKVRQALRQMAWRRLASLRMADALALTVADDEVRGAIAEQPFFQEGGTYNENRYRYFIHQVLGEYRATGPQFEAQVGEEIALAKLRFAVSQALWVPPSDLTQTYHQLYDTFTLAYAVLTQDEIAHRVRVTAADARAFFERHPQAFAIPKRVRVRYAAVPVAAFVDEGAVADEQMRSYYDEHIEDFSALGTDAWTTTQPFEAVEDAIRETLAVASATEQAEQLASDLEERLLAGVTNRVPPGLDVVARGMGLAVATTAWFSARERVPDQDAGAAFNQAAFELRPVEEERYSRVLRGKRFFYLLEYLERADARHPAFEEVRERALRAARDEAAGEELRALMTAISAHVAEALQQGRSFEQAAGAWGLEVTVSEPFSVTAGLAQMDDSDRFYTVVKEALNSRDGELVGPVAVAEGAEMALGCVLARVPAARAPFESLRPELAKYIKKKRQEALFADWQDYLLTSGGFEDHAPSAARDADTAAEDRDEDEDAATD